MDETFLNNINHLHPKQVEFFRQIFQQKQLGQAYLFYGYEGIGKDAFALELAATLLCENGPLNRCATCAACRQMEKLWHPDFYYIFPTPSKTNLKEEDVVEVLAEKAANPFVRIHFEEKNTFIGIDTVRELKNNLYTHPQQGEYKIALIQDVDTMRVEAINALLKILEEPPPYVYFFLTTSRVSRLLPTVLSRCQVIHFDRPEPEAMVTALKPYLNEKQLSQFDNGLRLADLNIKKTLEFMRYDFSEVKDLALDFFKKIWVKDWLNSHSIIMTINNLKNRRKIDLFLEFLAITFLDFIYFMLDQAQRIKNLELIPYFKSLDFPDKSPEMILQMNKLILNSKEDVNSDFNLNSLLVLDKLFYEIKYVVSSL